MRAAHEYLKSDKILIRIRRAKMKNQALMKCRVLKNNEMEISYSERSSIARIFLRIFQKRPFECCSLFIAIFQLRMVEQKESKNNFEEYKKVAVIEYPFVKEMGLILI